jgi:hypothetical protein
MVGPAPTETIVLWFVSDGTRDWYVSLDEAAAEVFAETVNRHTMSSKSRPVWIERRVARIV